jgi:hypothetical protein
MKPDDWLTARIVDMHPRPTDDLKAVESESVTTESVEQSDVGEALVPKLVAMRVATDGAAAYTAGEGLPEAVRLYVSGAVEFQAAAGALAADRDPSAHAAAALTYFERVLALPPEQRAPRATWASYMAGRTEQLAAAATDRAIVHFQRTRELALQGAPDPLGLAVASYGEEASIALEKGDIPRATDLYLEQAARSSSVASESLRVVARRLVSDPDLALRHIQNPRVQKLWLAGALTEGQGEFYFDNEFNQAPAYAPQSSWVARVNKVTAAIDRSKVTQLDQLAGLAYATGRFDLAESLAAGVNTPLASVVRAKLALRAGKHDVAAKEYAAAVTARNQPDETGEAGLPYSGWSRLTGEQGVLAMSQRDYAAALSYLLAAGGQRWGDAAYVAERVLTLDELVAFITMHAPPETAKSGDKAGAQPTPFERDYLGTPSDSKRALRLLLARRQMRDQRFDDALATFRANDFRLDEENSSLAAVATEYVAAIRASTSAWTDVERASQLFKAAQLAKRFGMELMGYELTPDFALYNGRMTRGWRDVAEGPYVTQDEVARVNAKQTPEARFHYRGVALDLAKRAADNLPARSHAFAAVLCTSLRWARSNGDAALAQTIYQRYVSEGAYVGWSEKFGGRCEAPDFPKASKLVWQTRMHSARVAVRPYKIPLVVLVAGGVIGAAVFVVRRRRR